ncbi:MAG: choice-of-anchor D domain-containing protein [Verrucomicrobiaceae bacterium]|nr:choice-of-anchor D domain-containing protein [Verrucomicrobiaceae bacterium]
MKPHLLIGLAVSLVALCSSVNAQQYQWSTFAGLAGSEGSANGTGSAARFSNSTGTAVDGDGNVYVADISNQIIRKITPAGVVTTLAGSPGSTGSTDGTGSAARFYNPSGVTADSSGNVYVADYWNHTIRKITPGGTVSTLAGLALTPGTANGTGSTARFRYPHDVAVDGSGNVYVADNENHTIRKVTSAGVVTTLAGLAGTAGSADGTGSTARFSNPAGVAVDSSGNVYVGDRSNHTIRKVTSAGVVTTLAGSAGVFGSTNATGSAARFYYPAGVAVDAGGNVYVGDTYNDAIRKITPGGVVTTIGGVSGSIGSTDGLGTAARFNDPFDVAVSTGGRLYVPDRGNDTIRRGVPYAPEITVTGNGQNITDGDMAPSLTDHTDYGSTPLGTPITRSFTVTNTGGLDLNVTGLTLPTGYEHVGTFAPFTLAPAAAQVVQLRLLANTVGGAFSGTMSILSDDVDEGSFDVALTGRVTFGVAIDEQWVQRYNGPANGNDYAIATVVDSASNAIVTGMSIGSGGNEDCYTAKYAAADGALLWEKRYNGPANSNDRGNSVAVDSADNVIIIGESIGSGTGYDSYTAKYAAADGALLWEKRYNGPANGYDIANSVAVDNAGNVIITGMSIGSGGNEDCYTAKYAATDGALLWEKRYNGPANSDDRGTRVAVDSADNVLITGKSIGSGTGYDSYTAKYAAADGALLWEKRYNGPANSDDGAYSVAVDSAGNVAVTGHSYIGTSHDYYTAKYAAADGALLWEKRYNGPANSDDGAYSVAVDNAGNVAVTGFSLDYNYGNNDYYDYDCYTAKYAAADGALLWEKRYNGPANGLANGFDLANSMAVDNAGNVIITGQSDGSGTASDYYTAKYAAADGALLWEQRYNGPANDQDVMWQTFPYAGKLALTPDGGAVVTGASSNGVNYDYATVFYGPAASAPTAITSAATTITSTTATLNGTGNPNGIITSAWFEWGTSTAYGQSTTSEAIGYGTSAVPVSANLTGLIPGTLYHYRLVAQNGETTAYGADLTFTTLTPYQVWAAANGVTGTNTGPNDDFDSDGIINQLEWAFGMDPTVSGTGVIIVSGAVIVQRGSPTVSVQNILNSVDYRALFGRRKDYLAAGLTYTTQFSADLGTWQNSTATPTVIADDGVIEACTVPYPFFINGKKARFFRVSVSVTP